MLSDEQFEVIRPKLKVLQIVAAAMVIGVIIFAAVTNVIFSWSQSTMKTSMLPLLGAAAFFFSAILSFVLPALTASHVTRISTDDKSDRQSEQLSAAADVFSTGRIIRLALLEGGCFLNLVVYLLEHSRLSLIVTAIGLFLLMLSFPNASSLRRWIEAKTSGQV